MEIQKTQSDFEKLVDFEKQGLLYDLIVKKSDLSIKTQTLEGIITSWNKGSENIYGYTAQEIIGKNVSILIPPSQANELILLINDLLQGKTIDTYITNRLRKDGKLIDVSISISLIIDKNGEAIGLHTVDKDITNMALVNKELEYQYDKKQKRADELAIANKELVFQNQEINRKEIANKKLEAFSDYQMHSSQYARSLIEASTDPLVTISLEGKITDVNESLVNVTGETREKLIGTDFSDYFTEPEKARQGYKQVFEKGLVSDYPLTIRHKKGKLTDVMYNASVYKDDKGNVLGVFAAARDITAIKTAYDYARSIIEASKDSLFVINIEGKIVDVNDATIHATDTSRSAIINTFLYEYVTDPDQAKIAHKQIFQKGYIKDFPLIMQDSTLTHVLCNGSVYRDDSGKVLGAVIVARDITEQKKIATELIEAKIFAELATEIAQKAKEKAEEASKIAEESVRAKQQFLSNMSHEIRTPMNAIIGFTKVILKTDLSPKQKEYLLAIKLSGDSLIVLINDILDLAKVDSGKMVFEETPFRLESSISAMLHLFEPKIEEKNLKLIRLYDNKIPDILVGDSVRLHQIILNLVSNSIKFTNAGTITVAVSLEKEDMENVTVKFSISDTGIGVAEDKIEHIFENFQQASSNTSRLYGGTGLGLAIVKQLIEAQNGTIEVTSTVDEGSTFTFILEFGKTNASLDFEIEPIELQENFKHIKVLVVEDIALNQLLMKTLLDDFGFERDIVSNGKLAVEILKNKTYDVILMDLQMPEMNGFEATTYIRQILKLNTPIMALTADVTTVDLDKCKSVGMNDYISKPVDEKLLRNKILSLVRKNNMNNILEIANQTEVEKIKCTDLTYLMRRTKSDPALMMEMISLYLKQTPMLVDAMKLGFKNKDWIALDAAVHKMLPSFSIMGIDKTFEIMAREIQDLVLNQQKDKEIEKLVLNIEYVLTQSCIELEFEYNSIKNKKHE